MKQSIVVFNLIAVCVLWFSGAAQAQAVYRIVGPDGKVTFSDKAPLDASKATTSSASGKRITATETGLPYELRQISSRYPVTLYSGVGCAPCNSGRLLLQGRGIPFTENSVTTPEDAEALKRISGDNSLPFLTIGGQKIKGFSESEWVQFLNAANYPATSLLPANYRNAPPKPLVMAQRPATAQGQTDAQASGDEKPADREPDTPQSRPAANSSNPTGIKF
ncbi:MAG: glutaredoxin family protein [Rhodoferax sp.]|nr:glutaredoxin family protein [Rhodoferax sp.]